MGRQRPERSTRAAAREESSMLGGNWGSVVEENLWPSYKPIASCSLRNCSAMDCGSGISLFWTFFVAKRRFNFRASNCFPACWLFGLLPVNWTVEGREATIILNMGLEDGAKGSFLIFVPLSEEDCQQKKRFEFSALLFCRRLMVLRYTPLLVVRGFRHNGKDDRVNKVWWWSRFLSRKWYVSSPSLTSVTEVGHVLVAPLRERSSTTLMLRVAIVLTVASAETTVCRIPMDGSQ